MMFFDMKDASEIPGITEPLFAGLNARLQLLPVMNADDLKKGLDVVSDLREPRGPGGDINDAVERIGGDRDDRDRFQGGIGFDAARGGIAVHDWQLNIHQDEIGPLSRDTEALVSQSCAL